jgi:hypothetical protein
MCVRAYVCAYNMCGYTASEGSAMSAFRALVNLSHLGWSFMFFASIKQLSIFERRSTAGVMAVASSPLITRLNCSKVYRVSAAAEDTYGTCIDNLYICDKTSI